MPVSAPPTFSARYYQSHLYARLAATPPESHLLTSVMRAPALCFSPLLLLQSSLLAYATVP